MQSLDLDPNIVDDNASVKTTDIAVFHELCNRDRVDLQIPYNRTNNVRPPSEKQNKSDEPQLNAPPDFLETHNIVQEKIPEEIFENQRHDAKPPDNVKNDMLSIISSIPYKPIVDNLSVDSRKSSQNSHIRSSKRNIRSTYEADATMDKAALLQDIKQLQMLNPNTCILSREFTMSDSYETIQLGLYQAKQSIDIASGVNTMKDVLKVGCTGIELGCNKFAKNYADLNGWSTEVATSIDGQSYNAPLQQIYRKYWRNGTNGMNPFLQLAFLLLGSAGIFGLKKKFLGTSGNTSIPSPPPIPNSKVPYESQAAMPHNTPRMKRPSNAPVDISEAAKSNDLKFTNFKPPNQGNIQQRQLPTNNLTHRQPPTNNLLTPGMIDPRLIAQTMQAVGPLMQTVGPMLPTMMSAMSAMA